MKTESATYNGIMIHHICGQVKKDFWSESYHSHEHAEIFIHVLGKMELFIENKIYYHTGNEIRLYAPWELHFGKADFDQDMEWYQISINNDFLKSNPSLVDKIVNREKGKGNVFISKKYNSIISLLDEIFEKQNSCLGQQYFISNIIKTLCILSEPQNNIDVKEGRNECIQKSLEVINQNLTHIKTVENISSLTHFSSPYIYRLFKTKSEHNTASIYYYEKIIRSQAAFGKRPYHN